MRAAAGRFHAIVGLAKPSTLLTLACALVGAEAEGQKGHGADQRARDASSVAGIGAAARQRVDHQRFGLGERKDRHQRFPER